MRASHLFIVGALLVPATASAEDFKNQGYLNQGYLNQGYLNQGYLNGGTTGGVTLDVMHTAQGQPIDSVSVDKDVLTGWAWVWEFDHYTGFFNPVNGWHYRELTGDDWLNATFDVTVYDTSDVLVGAITAKITDIRTSGAYHQHVVKWIDASTGVETPVCGCENDNPNGCTAPIPATFVQGQWNYSEGTLNGGKKISNNANYVTVACAQAAISKCASDKSWSSPVTPYYSGTVSPAYATFQHVSSFIAYPDTKVTVTLTNVVGNPNLYVRWNNQNTTSSYTCRPANGAGMSETCNLTAPANAYLAYVSVYGASAGASATVTVTGSGGSPRGLDYEPYVSVSCDAGSCTTSPSQHAACTRMVTADYCGDGTSHTVTGRPIDVFDHYWVEQNVQDPTSSAQYKEARWTSAGADWVFTCRVNDLDLSDADPFSCPTYVSGRGTTYHHDIGLMGTINDADGNPTACTIPFAFQFDTSVDDYLYNFNTGTYYPRRTRSFSFFR